MTIAPTLKTERLTLRAPQLADADLYAQFFESATGSGHYGGPLRRDQAFDVLCKDIGHWALMSFGKWTLEVSETKTPIGGCGLVHPRGWNSAELTWWLLPEHRGHGYATEASHAAIAFGYDTLNWSSVETHMRDENTPAVKIVERLGGGITRRETFPDGVARNIYHLPRIAKSEVAA